jgi:hypothetical protein
MLRNVLALDVRTGIATALAATTTIALLVLPAHDSRRWTCGTTVAAATPAMPDPDPEPVVTREATAAPLTCEDPGVQTVVFKGRVNALDDGELMTFHFRFADLPARYTVVTGAHGEFVVRVSREELGLLDLCTLPMSGLRAAQFHDGQLSIEYTLSFER